MKWNIHLHRGFNMLVTTTPTIEGHPIEEHLGVVSAQVVLGANFLRDWFAGWSDMFGGRSKTYEEVLRQGTEDALMQIRGFARERGANAIVGLSIQHQVFGSGRTGGMMMVCIIGTAVKAHTSSEHSL
jgi:uncharacterized protein YbjQ (UPF0145 family)